MSRKTTPDNGHDLLSPTSSWTEAPLRSVLQILQTGTRPKGGVRGIKAGVPSIGGEHLDGRGGFDFTNVKYVPEQFFTSMQRGHIHTADILVVKDGATTGKVSLVRDDFPFTKAVINEHVFCCRVREGIEPRFLFWYLLSQEGQQRILENFKGSAQGGINQSFADNTLVPLTTHWEQRRIVEAIERLLARVDVVRNRLSTVPRILQRFRQAVLAAACSGRLTEDWRENHRSIEPSRISLKRFDDRRLPQKTKKNLTDELDLDLMPSIPETWEYRRADTIVAPDTIITYGIVLPGPEVPRGIPYVRQQDIQDGGVLVEQLRHTTPGIAAKHVRSVLAEGDVLLCIIRHLRVAIVPRGLDGANLTQGTVRMRPSSVVSGTFLARFLASEHAQAWMKQRHFGMSMPRINVEHARAIPVAVPPMVEQAEIVRRVESLMKLADAIERRVAVAQARADKLTQSVLAKAFRGELVSAAVATGPVSVGLAQPLSQPGATWTIAELAAIQAEIVRRETTNPTLGRKKLYKLGYLTAAVAGARLQPPPMQMAAGPFNRNAQADVESLASTEKWFHEQRAAGTQREGGYRPGAKAAKAYDRARELLGDHWKPFERLLGVAAKWDSDAAELHATVHAAWNDLIAGNQPADDEAIARRFYDWSTEKTKFSKFSITEAIRTLERLDLRPTGKGPLIAGAGEAKLF